MTERPVVNGYRYLAVLEGREPAEVLRPAERDRLMRRLVGEGWTDIEIAAHTKWSTYTVTRIRERLGLRQNIETDEVVA
jgi:hypothetical protein